MGELTSAVISLALSDLLARESILRTDPGSEDIHKGRVEIQRLRGRLRTLRPVLDRQWVEDTDRELKWLADLLGAIREADVHSAALHRHVDNLPAADVAAAQELLSSLTAERSTSVRSLAAGLEDDRFNRLVDTLLAAAADPPTDDPEALRLQARAELPKLIAKRWRRLQRDVQAIGADDPSDDVLHGLRKTAKRLRYACEMASSLLGPAPTRLGKAATRLQGVLGEVHDAATAERWLRHRVLVLGNSASAVAAGEMIERERARSRRCQAQWPKRWRKLRRKKLRRWLHGS